MTQTAANDVLQQILEIIPKVAGFRATKALTVTGWRNVVSVTGWLDNL